MIKCLYFLLFVATSHVFAAKEKRETEDIPSPRLIKITLIDEPSLAFKVDWKKVSTSKEEDADPIEGYKLKVWEEPQVKRYRYVTVNGSRVLVSDSDVYSSHPDEVTTRKSRVILVHGVENNSAQVNDIEPGVTYEVKVVAFTRNGDGPLSQPMKIQISAKKDDSNQKNQSNEADD